MSLERVTGLVLAGGRASRLGGLDKGLQMHQGERLAARALGYLDGCTDRLISANRNLPQYREFGVRVISDRREDFQGPLSGIETALEVIDTPWLYVLPCDVQGMPADWVRRLLRAASETQSPWVGTRDDCRMNPLLSLWSRDLLPSLSAYLDSGERRAMGFVVPWAASVVALPANAQLSNLNTPQAFQA